MSISFISNSGIQFHTFELKIDPMDDFKTMGFYEKHERLDEDNMKISLEYACFLPDNDIWVPKKFVELGT